MVRPRFSPRPTATATAFANGQSQTSPAWCSLSVVSILTLRLLPPTAIRSDGAAAVLAAADGDGDRLCQWTKPDLAGVVLALRRLDFDAQTVAAHGHPI